MFLNWNKLRFTILLISFVLAICVIPSNAQGVCSVITLKVDRVAGKIVSQGRLEEPITQTKVELKRLDEAASLVASTETNDLGYFELDNIKKGKYVFVAWFTIEGETYLKYRLLLKVKKSNDAKSKSLILVKLGADCFSSEASVVK